MKNLFLSTLMLLLFLSACHPDPEVQPVDLPTPIVKVYPTDTLPNLGHIHFNNMQIGQQSRYVRYYMAHVAQNNDTTVQYLPDTLITVITGEDAEGFIVKEYYSRGSSIISGTNPSPFYDTIYSYHLRIINDSLHVIKAAVDGCYCSGSQLYALTRPLPLLPIESPKLDYWVWHSTYESSQYYKTAYVENQTHWGQNFDRLNIVFDNTDIGLYFAYSPTYGLVRFSYYSLEFVTDGRGWDLLPE